MQLSPVDSLLAEDQIEEAIRWLESFLHEPVHWLRHFELLITLGKLEEAQEAIRKAPASDQAWTDFVFSLDGLRVAWDERERFYTSKGSFARVDSEPKHLKFLNEAIHAVRKGKLDRAEMLHDQSAEETPELVGHLDGREFEGIRDLDDRLACVVEVIWESQFLRLAFSDLKRLRFMEAPLIGRPWRNAEVTLHDGTELLVSIPTLYPNSFSADANGLKLGQEADFEEWIPGLTAGIGAKIWWIGDDEYTLNEWTQLEIRTTH
jgi:type VI secretion system protein ImpE